MLTTVISSQATAGFGSEALARVHRPSFPLSERRRAIRVPVTCSLQAVPSVLGPSFPLSNRRKAIQLSLLAAQDAFDAAVYKYAPLWTLRIPSNVFPVLLPTKLSRPSLRTYSVSLLSMPRAQATLSTSPRKAHACDACPSSFKRKWELDRHSKIHAKNVDDLYVRFCMSY